MQSRYVQIAELLRGQIADGQYPLGSRIPTENELDPVSGRQPSHCETGSGSAGKGGKDSPG